MNKSVQPSTSAAASCSTIRLQRELRKRKQEDTEDTDIGLFCEQLDTKDDILHSFQKIELTEELKNKALLIGDSNVHSKVRSANGVSHLFLVSALQDLTNQEFRIVRNTLCLTIALELISLKIEFTRLAHLLSAN